MFGNKIYTFFTALITFLILMTYILNIPALIIVSVSLIIMLIMFGNSKLATSVLFYFTAFSYVIMYGRLNLYVLIAVAYILSALRFGVMDKRRFVLVLFLLFYTITVTVAGPQSYKLGDFFSIIVLLLVFFVCSSVKHDDIEDITNAFILGFIVSAIIGLFVEDIPALREILNQDRLWISGSGINSVTLDRFSGLACDPNFYGMYSVVITSIILFRENTRHKIALKVVLVFLVISGFLTYSKTYVIVLALVFVIYIFRVDRAFLNRMIFGSLFILLCVALDYMLDLDMISPIIVRFTRDSGFSLSQMTTGRTEIWADYLYKIFFNGSSVIFGVGVGSGFIRMAEHNTYIEYLFKFGTVGCFIWYKFLKVSFATLKERTQEKKEKFLWVPSLVLCLYIFSVSAMTSRMFWMLICISMFNFIPTVKEGTVNKLND